MKIRVIPVSVYRFPLGDCTNNGVSKFFDKLLIACPDGPDSFDSDVCTPVNFCMIERRRLHHVFNPSSDSEYLTVVPAAVNDQGQTVKRPGWWMNGGNIAATSDSRFRNMSDYPLCIHDRRE
ncbi:MAG: hypothetical protein IKN04_09160 [Clostridia bacterium]|nr:hypothetical protein [Clostridia bacterium]